MRSGTAALNNTDSEKETALIIGKYTGKIHTRPGGFIVLHNIEMWETRAHFYLSKIQFLSGHRYFCTYLVRFT